MLVFDAKCRKFVVYFVCFAALTKGKEGDSIGVETDETFPWREESRIRKAAEAFRPRRLGHLPCEGRLSRTALPSEKGAPQRGEPAGQSKA